MKRQLNLKATEKPCISAKKEASYNEEKTAVRVVICEYYISVRVGVLLLMNFFINRW